jgi:hypothetical protein
VLTVKHVIKVQPVPHLLNQVIQVGFQAVYTVGAHHNDPAQTERQMCEQRARAQASQAYLIAHAYCACWLASYKCSTSAPEPVLAPLLGDVQQYRQHLNNGSPLQVELVQAHTLEASEWHARAQAHADSTA